MQTPETDQINEVTGWRRLALLILATLIRVWGRTLRFEADPDTLARLTKSDEPAALVLWHNRLFLSPEISPQRSAPRSIF